MASRLVIRSSSARRVEVKTTPAKHLSDVMQEACQRLGLKAEEYTLKYNKKSVDLSLTVRLANLPPGAQLDLVLASRSPTVVSIALQLPPGEAVSRLTNKFSNATSLWQVLRYFEDIAQPKLNFTQRGVPQIMSGAVSGAGRLNYEMPVLSFINREVAGDFVGLQKTLAQCGIRDGTALLKLSFRNSGQPLEEAMQEISQYFQSMDEPSASAVAARGDDGASSSETVSVPEPTTTKVSKDVTGLEDPPDPALTENIVQEPPSSLPPASIQAEIMGKPTSINAVAEFGQRFIQVYAPSQNATPQAVRQAYDPEDYVPTIDHAKLHQARLQGESRNKRLLSDAEIAEQERVAAERLAAVDGVTIRIRLPDQSQVEARFGRLETAAALYDLVRSMLRHDGEPFALRYVGPKGNRLVLRDGHESLVQDLKIKANTLMTLVWGDDASFSTRQAPSLKPEWISKAQQIKVEEPVSVSIPESSQVRVKKGKAPKRVGNEDKENMIKSKFMSKLFKK